ncbi:MAG TPA: UDP-N-acetylmuramate dehydrogenase [Terriglobales bacterium]|nr:UDP-N-acetylmuramate dehydrogenase [Terriglobales bacterium]
MQFQENVPLGPMTTLGVGGPSRWYAEARTEEELRAAVEWAGECRLPLFILGGGSNLVVSDAGWPGLTLRVGLRGVKRRREGEREIFEAGAGEDWDELVACAVGANCAGVECLSGIPGTVGGTPVQNVGAYGQDVSETLVGLRALELATGRFREFTNEECGFAYRTSRFNTTDRDKFVITRVTYALTPNARPKIEYADLKKHFSGRDGVSLADVREAVREIRRSKAMLIVEGDEDSRSAGSFFRNPVVDVAAYERLAAQVAAKGLVPPNYPAGQGKIKVAAAWLVEHSGFERGFTMGRVGISRRHALAIVNRGGATATEIIGLKDLIQQKVRDTFGVELVPEPVFVGL